MMEKQRTRLGKFDLLARIAKGGMAEIFLARQHGATSISRLVVVKRILAHLAEEPQFVEMFLEEARLAALINHPNVVQIFDVGGEAEGGYYIAMEYINGPSVGTICRRARHTGVGLPYAVAGEIVAQACDGLDAAHELCDEEGRPVGLVHRDVSPHNLMITDSGVVKLVDFGIAKAQGSSVRTRTGNIKGKFPYLSPEQCRGEALTRRSDLFSLGIVFYELLAARRLFHRPTDLMVLKAITEDEIVPPNQACMGLPQAINEIILKALQRRPGARYGSAAQMGQAIRNALAELEQRTSARTLAEFLFQVYADDLRRRETAVRHVARRSSRSSLLIVTGFDDTNSTVGEEGEASAAPTRARGKVSLPWRWLGAGALIVLAALLGLAYRIWGSDGRPAGPAIRYGFPRSFSTATSRKDLATFTTYLESQLKRPVEIVIPESYQALRQKLLRGEIDLAALPPLQFVMAQQEAPSIDVLATHLYEGARIYQGYLIVRSDSPVTSIEQLKGRRVCYVDTGSTSGYLLPRHFLRQNKLNPDEIFPEKRFSGTHSQLMRDVIAGRCDVGGVYSGAMLNAASLGIPSARLRMLAVTGTLPYDLVCASPKLAGELISRIRQALLRFDAMRHLGQKTVGDVYRITGFVAPRIAEFEAVRVAARAEGLLR
jgi:serine/threonine-protein kinase